jgi:succinoglycan biosynthesis transport protein ExoP
VELRDYLVVLRRSWLIIVACTVIGAAVGMIVSLTTPTTYRASTQLFVAVQNTGAASDLALSTSFGRQAVTSYVTVIPTAIVLDPVIEELDLDGTSRDLAGRVSASAPRNSQVIEITVTDRSPSEAAQIANAVAASFADAVATQLERPAGTDASSKVRIESLAPATVPTDPAAPNGRLNVALGLLVGLAAGVGVAVLRAVLDTRVHTSADVEAVLEAPILGGVPFDPDSAKRPLIVQASPRDPRAEAFRRIRTNLQFLGSGDGPPVFVVTSASPAEGKTTTAANLALTLAEIGARVALIDADLRKPRVADLFALEGAVGLSDVLTGRAQLSQVMQPSGAGKLFLLPAGAIPPNPAELLGSKAMRGALRDLKQAFDYVLIDAPPALAVTDAAIVSRLATGVIVVAASGSTRTPALQNAATALAAVDARLLGVVLTKLPTKGPDSYGYGEYTYGVTRVPA